MGPVPTSAYPSLPLRVQPHLAPLPRLEGAPRRHRVPKGGTVSSLSMSQKLEVTGCSEWLRLELDLVAKIGGHGSLELRLLPNWNRSLRLEVTGYTALAKKRIWSQRLEVKGCIFLIHRKQLSLRELDSPSHKICTDQATVAVIFGRHFRLVLKKFQKGKVNTLHFQASRVSTFGVVACTLRA
jgi:hypothetical protein